MSNNFYKNRNDILKGIDEIAYPPEIYDAQIDVDELITKKNDY